VIAFSLFLTLTHSLLLHATIALFHIAIYTLVSLLLVLRLLLASLLEIVFNFALFAIILQPLPIHPPLGDLQPLPFFGLNTLRRSVLDYICSFAHLFVFMVSHDFSSIKSQPKFDGLNFTTWKVKMTLFLKSLGVRIGKALTKKFVVMVMRIHGPKQPSGTMNQMPKHNMH